MDDDDWVIELESALLDECRAGDVYGVCKGRPLPEGLRSEVWQACLDARADADPMATFDEIFDLAEQATIRGDVRVLVDSLGNDEADRVSVASDLESIITFHCKSRSLQYTPGWTELLPPLLQLKLPRSQTYLLFSQIVDLYVPQNCVKGGAPFHILWLLLQYHDPELCSFFDAKRIPPELYSAQWLRSLFAGSCSLPVVRTMWDLYFQRADPYFVYFLALIMIVNCRDRILSKVDESRDAIVEFLAGMPNALDAEDVADFCSLAGYYSHRTPVSFRTESMTALSGALCLPVSVRELVESATAERRDEDDVRFFLVDCRSADQYNAGRLSTAFHLDRELMLHEPEAFATAVRGLLSAQKQALAANSAAAGEHICVLGSGRREDDGYVHMIVASFLKRNVRHVSTLDGGYVAVHDYFGDRLAECLEDHDPNRCLVCSPDALSPTPRRDSSVRKDRNATSIDLFSKLSAAMRTKSQEVTGKLMDYIVNPNATGPSPAVERHASKNDRNAGKRYRNVAPVFSIDEDDDCVEESEPDEDDTQEFVDLDAWLKNPEAVGHFPCQEVMSNGFMHDAHLVVTNSHLVVMRDTGKEHKGMVQIIVRRPLSTVVKITARKRHPELITFKYGTPEGDTLVIKDMDRFLIPNATEATRLVSRQIVQNS